MISSEEMARIIRIQMAQRDVKTFKEICKATGISGSSFSKYLSGDQVPPLHVLSRICGYLGMTQEQRGAFLM